MTGKQKKSDGLWDIPLTPPSQPSQAVNAIIQMKNTKK